MPDVCYPCSAQGIQDGDICAKGQQRIQVWASRKGLPNGCHPDILEDALAAVGRMGPRRAGKIIGERGQL